MFKILLYIKFVQALGAGLAVTGFGLRLERGQYLNAAVDMFLFLWLAISSVSFPTIRIK